MRTDVDGCGRGGGRGVGTAAIAAAPRLRPSAYPGSGLTADALQAGGLEPPMGGDDYISSMLYTEARKGHTLDVGRCDAADNTRNDSPNRAAPGLVRALFR